MSKPPAPDETHVIRDLSDTLHDIMETTSRDYGHAVRAVHAKSPGIIRGELEILPDLPAELPQGIFAHPGRHPAIIRISTNPGDLLHDSISVPRGLALKILGVEGERLEGAEGQTQDFIFVNGPIFITPDPASFLKNLKLLAKTTDRAEWAKRDLSAVLRGAAELVDDYMRFSVWTRIEAHRPLGAINRARQEPYRMLSQFRADFNGCPIHEPASHEAMT